MIVFTASPKFFAPVTLKQLDEKGALQELKFDAQFRRLKQTESDAVLKECIENENQRTTDALAGVDTAEKFKAAVLKLLDAYMVGWAGVQDEAGNAVPFTAQSLRDLCEEHRGMLQALYGSFFSASFEPKNAAHLAAKN